MASSSSSSGRLPLQRALQNLRMECETGGQQRLQSQLNGKSIEELRKLCIAAGVSIRLDVLLSGNKWDQMKVDTTQWNSRRPACRCHI